MAPYDLNILVCFSNDRIKGEDLANESKKDRYNQVPHLSQDTELESNKITIKIPNKSQEVSPFPSGDHKAAMNRRESMPNTWHTTKEV